VLFYEVAGRRRKEPASPTNAPKHAPPVEVRIAPEQTPQPPTIEPPQATAEPRADKGRVSVPVPGIQPSEETGRLVAFLTENPLVPLGVGAALLLVVAVILWNRPPTPTGAVLPPPTDEFLSAALEKAAATTEMPVSPPTRPRVDLANVPQPEEGTTQQTAEQTVPPRPVVELPRGYHYVVVQHFPKRRRDHAEKAAQFLMEHGLPCALLPGPDIRLVIAEPFLIRQDDKEAAARERRRGEEMVRRVKELGKLYRRHGYSFAGAALREIR